MRRLLLPLWLIVAVLTVRAAEPVATADTSPVVQIGAAPAWVQPESWTLPVGDGPGGFPAEVLLIDAQDSLTAGSSEYYFHTVVRLLTAAGVREYSRQTNEFSPAYENVTWHTLKITRDGRVVNRLPGVKFTRLQRELELENQLFTGLVTAAAVLEDVRVGDVIETAYTLRSDNPALRGILGARHYLGSMCPVRREVITVHVPADAPAPAWNYFIPPATHGLPEALFRHAALRSALEDKSTAAGRVYRWEAADLPAITFEGGIPTCASPYWPMLRCSSIRAWGEVADWAVPLFASAGELPADAHRMVEKWKKDLPTPADRLKAAVRWVQDDIRYFSMAVGEHNLRPRPLADVCSTRFGDCKDKAMLLTTILRELGFEAWPALVNTELRDRLDEYGPSPVAFNHAIVAYQFEGQLRWLDATLKHQQGPIGRWAVPPYRRALIVRPETTDLSVVPSDDEKEPDMVTCDRITIDAATGTATLTTEVTVRDLQADFFRQSMETTTPEVRSTHWFNYLGRFYKKIEEVDPPVVRDDPVANRIVMTARYRIPGFMATEDGNTVISTYAYALRTLLDPPETRRRHWPYALPSDRFVRHRIEMDLPFDLPYEQQPQTIRTDGIEYRVEKGLAGKRFVAEHDLRFTGDYVPPEHMGSFCDAVDEILGAMSTSLHKGAKEPAKPAGPSAKAAVNPPASS
ncbi:MAG: DUF3857 and transglutaminase domain-containing protein [Verrucomicrobia bacterium]|nr:DUF3857 and transglutaminase domain-containing protein [Verrucomicrobiota bacterium]